MKVLAILLVIGVSWVAAHPGLFDWQDNANKLLGGLSGKKDVDEEDSGGIKKGLLGPVKEILENVNSLGGKLIPASILDSETLGKLDVLNLWNKDGDDGIVKDVVSPLANILGKDNLVDSIISSALGVVKENVLGDVVDKVVGGIGGGKGGKKLISSRKNSHQESSKLSEKESESEKESSESYKFESEEKEKSSKKESEQKSEEESSVIEEIEESEE